MPCDSRPMASALVHIIDDDEAVRDALSVLLRIRGVPTRAYASAEAFLAAAPPSGSGCIVTDVQMAQITGVELLSRLKVAQIFLPVIVMTGRASRGLAAEAVRRGAWAFIDKPFVANEFVERVLGALAEGEASA